MMTAVTAAPRPIFMTAAARFVLAAGLTGHTVSHRGGALRRALGPAFVDRAPAWALGEGEK